MNLQNNWSQISVAQYYELEDLKKELSGTELILERLAILLDTDIYDDEIYNLSVEDLFILRDKISWLDTEPNVNITDVDFNLKPKKLNKLFLGEFIDIEHYYNEPNSLHIISAIYFKKTKIDEWGNEIFEPYVYDLEERSKLFLDLPITFVLKYFKIYENWRENFLKNYEELFMYDDSVDETELEGLELLQYQKEMMVEKAESKWSWESILYGLSSGDLTKFNNLFDCEVILVFNMLSMRKTLNIE